MLKSSRSRTHAIIIILVVFFSTPIKGIAQTKGNNTGSKEQSANSHLSSPTKTKKSDTQKGVKIKKLQSESEKFSKKIKLLEKNLSLAKAELEGLKKTDAKKSEELKKLNENVNYLLESIDDQKTELAELSIYSGVSKKYKEIVKCYRSALFAWNNLISRKGLTEKEYLVVTVELRQSLFACPPI